MSYKLRDLVHKRKQTNTYVDRASECNGFRSLMHKEHAEDFQF